MEEKTFFILHICSKDFCERSVCKSSEKNMYKINNKKTSELSKRVLVFGLIGVTAFGLLASTLLSGCGKNENITDNSSAMTEKDYQKLSEQMEEGKYYILHNGEVSMITTAEETSPSNGTIAWFDHTAYDNIVTMYKGDKLIYYTTNDIDESFSYTRFLDMGYTIPIAGLEAGASGKFHISTSSDAGTVYPDSSATSLYEFQNDQVIVDKIGGVSLTADNVSDYGTVTGLEQDEEYNIDLYSGSVLTKTSMYANIRAMGLDDDQSFTTNKFDFLSGEVIQIGLPNWFNSGYYEINGLGIFRYVNGTSYDETTNFNIANTVPEADAGEDVDLDVTNLSDTFTIEEEGTYRVTVTMSYPSDMEKAAASTEAVITAPDGEHYTMYNNGSGQLVFQKNDMVAGTYTIGYTNANGLKPEIAVEKTAPTISEEANTQ